MKYLFGIIAYSNLYDNAHHYGDPYGRASPSCRYADRTRNYVFHPPL